MTLKCKRVDIKTLYSYCGNTEDRRKESQPAGIERRSGIERRRISRYELDNSVKNDFQSVKNTYDKFINNSNKLFQEVNKFDKVTKSDDQHKKEIALTTASIIPQVSRFMIVENAFNDGDIIKTLGKWTLLLISFKADNLDLKDSFKQLKDKNFTVHETHLPFSFIRDTSLENSNNTIIKKLNKFDKTLFDLKPVQNLMNLLGINYEIILSDKVQNGVPVIGYKFTNKNWGKKILGTTLTRVTLLGLVFNALLELPGIKKAEDKKAQVKKSCLSITSDTCFSALLGAIGAYAGPIGSLVGIAFGFFVSDKVISKTENNSINRTSL